jgi:hypothetical protein
MTPASSRPALGGQQDHAQQISSRGVMPPL